MTDYGAKVSGLLGASFPWSFGLWLTSSNAEGTVAGNFNTAVGTLFTTATHGLENFMSADVTVTGTSVSTLNATMHQTTITRNSLDITGTDENDSLPWDTSEIVTLRSAQATKSGHGRINLPPFAEDQVASHVILSATITSMQTVFNAFFAALVADDISLFIFNKRTKKDGTAPYTKTALTSYDLPDKPAVQRRRVSKLVPTRVAGTF
jgi:hypothetical protein